MVRRVICFIAVIFVVVVLPFGSCWHFSHNDRTDVITVKEKTVKVDSNSSRYLIFCKKEDGTTEVFENTDDMLRGKFNSSDVYMKLKNKHKYRIISVGIRIPFLSTYRNIIKVENKR